MSIELLNRTALSAPTIDVVVNDLIVYAVDNHGLETSSAWKLADFEARRLTEATGYTPPGGWNGVAGLAAGAGILKAEPARFVAVVSAVTSSEAEAQQRLLGAFTEKLCPPAAAAVLFITLGVHPIDGLRVAQHRQGAEAHHDGHLASVEALILSTIYRLLVELDTFAPGAISEADAAWLVQRIVREERADAIRQQVHLTTTAPELEEMLATELIELVLVPAGYARHYDSGVIELLRPLV